MQSSKLVTPDQVKAVFSENFNEAVEQTYDIFLLPPGEDPESCQSYLRMRNREGKYSLMFEVLPLNLMFGDFDCDSYINLPYYMIICISYQVYSNNKSWHSVVW